MGRLSDQLSGGSGMNDDTGIMYAKPFGNLVSVYPALVSSLCTSGSLKLSCVPLEGGLESL